MVEQDIIYMNLLFFSCIYPFYYQRFTVLSSITERYVNYFYFPYYFANFYPNYIIQRYNFMLFLQNIIITVTINGQFIKINFTTCLLIFYLMFCHFIIHSLVSSRFHGSSSKDSVIIKNFIILLAF